MITWHGCYKDGWKGIIVDGAFQHPAKFSRALIHRIYEHMISRDWIRPGESVIDPFGGVALGALEAMRNGLHWVGVELEPRFVTLGQGNIVSWNATYGKHFRGWGTATLLQGDSRRLTEVLRDQLYAGSVSSPPYACSLGEGQSGIDWGKQADREAAWVHGWNGEIYGSSEGQLGAMVARGFDVAVSSPPYADQPTKNGGDLTQWAGKRRIGISQNRNEGYGDSDGQLGAMAVRGFDAAVSSPPFEDSLSRDAVNSVDRIALARARGISNAEHVTPIDMEQVYSRDQEYGSAEGQLGAMRGGFDAVVCSPPFVSSVGSDDPQKRGGLFRDPKRSGDVSLTAEYGNTDGQLGAMGGREFDSAVSSPPYQTGGGHKHQMDAWNTNGRGQSGHSGGYADESDGQVQGDGNDFWLAARAVVEQTYQVLVPGAIAVWVCKDFVRNKRRVPFSDQWRQLSEVCGFELVEWIHASLVTDNGVQCGLFGEDVTLRKERKSFFRRLAESKGSPRIDWEDVLFMRRV